MKNVVLETRSNVNKLFIFFQCILFPKTFTLFQVRTFYFLVLVIVNHNNPGQNNF